MSAYTYWAKRRLAIEGLVRIIDYCECEQKGNCGCCPFKDVTQFAGVHCTLGLDDKRGYSKDLKSTICEMWDQDSCAESGSALSIRK